MDSSSMSPADIMALSGNEGMGGNSWLVMMFFIFMLAGGWGGGWGGNNFANAIGYENLATSNEVQRGFDAQNSMANERDILAAINATAAQGIAAGSQNTQYITGALNDKYSELQRDIAGLGVGQANILAAQGQCCSALQMQVAGIGAGLDASIAQSRYDAALGNAGVVQAIREEGNATRAMMQQNKIESLQQRLNGMEQALNNQMLQNTINEATAGTIKYPNQWVYNAGQAPFCGCGCYNV
jgi:hypothetical protein